MKKEMLQRYIPKPRYSLARVPVWRGFRYLEFWCPVILDRFHRIWRWNMTKKQLAEFKKLLLGRLEIVKSDVNQMGQESLNKSFTDMTGDIAKLPGDIADISSESFDHEFSVKLLENKGQLAGEIEAALERLNDGVYGLCDECEEEINTERLRAIPYARLCIECQRKNEKER